jgi:gamma-glutamylcyclotransferase
VAVRYFAYGSNMAERAMTSRCPGSRLLGRAELRNHRLAFTRRSIKTGTGVADAVPAQGETVWGALYEVEESGLAALDRKEGHGWAYERVPVMVHLDGQVAPTEAVTYRVLQPEPAEVTPSEEYVRALVEAAREHRLPTSYVEHLIRLQQRLAQA